MEQKTEQRQRRLRTWLVNMINSGTVGTWAAHVYFWGAHQHHHIAVASVNVFVGEYKFKVTRQPDDCEIRKINSS